MIAVDGIGRSGTSLLARLLAIALEDQGYAYFYEPFFHPTPVGPYPDWEAMIGRVLAPGDADPELEGYLTRLQAAAPKVLWKEIRLALKQDWLLRRFPDLRIVHLTRDIMGALSSHRRPDSPGWMDRHRRVWVDCLRAWSGQIAKLKAKKVQGLGLLEGLDGKDEFELYSAVWALNESFAWKLASPRLLCVEYEDLCLYPMETLDRISKFLAVPFERDAQDRALRHLTQSSREWDPSGPGAGRPLKEMSEIWRERLSPAEIASIQRSAGAVRKSLGYPAA